MRAEGIGIGVHYPAIHLFALYPHMTAHQNMAFGLSLAVITSYSLHYTKLYEGRRLARMQLV